MRTETRLMFGAVVLLLTGFVAPTALLEYLQFSVKEAPFAGTALAVAYAKPFLRWLSFLIKT